MCGCFFCPIRTGGYWRTCTRQDCSFQKEGHVDGWHSAALGYDVGSQRTQARPQPVTEARIVVDISPALSQTQISPRARSKNWLPTASESKRSGSPPMEPEYGHQRFSHGALYLLLQKRTLPRRDRPQGSQLSRPACGHRRQTALGSRSGDTYREPRGKVGACSKQPSLLTGILFDEAGGKLTPTYCVKKGTRYRYYVSTSLVTGPPKGGWDFVAEFRPATSKQ